VEGGISGAQGVYRETMKRDVTKEDYGIQGRDEEYAKHEPTVD